MANFGLNYKNKFKSKYKKLAFKNKDIIKKVDKTLFFLRNDPLYPSLKSHKVTDVNGDQAFSSSVTGDLRILWDYNKDDIQILDIMDIGGHSGGDKVYK